MLGGKTLDYVGGSHLFDPSNVTFDQPDRFGNNAGSTVSLNLGYLKVPEGVYFAGSLTISAWVYLRYENRMCRLIDFGNGPDKDNIVLALTSRQKHPYFHILSGNNKIVNYTHQLPLHEWTHLAVTLDAKNSKACIYVNSREPFCDAQKPPIGFNRLINFVGRSSWFQPDIPLDQDADAIFDDLKFYHRALTPEEIEQDMNCPTPPPTAPPASSDTDSTATDQTITPAELSSQAHKDIDNCQQGSITHFNYFR